MLVDPASPLDPQPGQEVNNSRLVHTSLEGVGQLLPAEESGGETGTNTPDAGGKDEKDDEGEGELPDHDERSIANTRLPRDGDGILELDELVRMMTTELPGGATSAPGSIGVDTEEECFGSRGGLEGMKGQGRDEPAYTCYTPLFKLTLGEWMSYQVFGRLAFILEMPS